MLLVFDPNSIIRLSGAIIASSRSSKEVIQMKKCKACQKEIDPKATKCPYCQVDQRSWFRKHPIITAILVLIALSMVGSVGKGVSSTASPSKIEETKQSLTPTAVPTIIIYEKVTAKQIVDDYDKNKLAADDKYKNKPVEFAAKVKNISTDIVGSPYLSLEPATADQYYFGTTLKCSFKTTDELKSLENGKTYTMRGIINEMSLGIVDVKDCSIVID